MHSKQEAVLGEWRPTREVEKKSLLWCEIINILCSHFLSLSASWLEQKKHNSSRHAHALNKGSEQVPAKHHLTNEDLVRFVLDTDE